ncbi:hypothetical protein [Thermincola ferriacetica]
MTKKFITSVALQALKPYKYDALGNHRLAYDRETCFPIIPVIYNNVNPEEKIKVIIMKTKFDPDNERERNNYLITEDNVKKLEDELRDLAAEKNFSYEITTIQRPFEDRKMAHMELYKNIISMFEDEDILFADITYSMKTVPIILFAAFRYAYSLKKDVEIGCISYGNLNFLEPDPVLKAKIYDVTALFYIDSVVESVSRMNSDNPEALIDIMLDLKGK